mgnify:CR=1 FL=1|tara:strand:+ start:40 stop:252 length:213 start_codon:yes stop_codon:yes gene_type:complete
MFIMAQDSDIWRNWSTTRRDIQRRWTQLTNGDLDMIAGDRERLVVRIVDRYGIAKEWAEHQVGQWERQDA